MQSRDEQFGLISFNYDTLLDQAVRSVFTSTLPTFDAYMDFPIVKPHGSVNWLLQRRDGEPDMVESQFDVLGRTAFAASMMFEGAPHLSPFPLSNLRSFDPAHKLDYSALCVRFGYLYPLILMPLTAKQYGTVQGFLDRCIERCQSMIAQADEVFLIGYSANDGIIEEILKPARPYKTRLHVVGRGSAYEILKRVLNVQPNLVEGFPIDGGFEAFVEDYERLSP